MSVVERKTNTILRSVGFEFNKPVASADLNESQSLIINNILEFMSGKIDPSTLKLTINEFTDSATGITVTGARFCVIDANSNAYFGYIAPNTVLTYPGTPAVGSEYDIYAYWRAVELTPASTVYLNGIRANASQPSIVETTTTNNILDTNLNEEVSNRKGLELTFVVVASGDTAPTLSGWSAGVKISEVKIGTEGSEITNTTSPMDDSSEQLNDLGFSVVDGSVCQTYIVD